MVHTFFSYFIFSVIFFFSGRAKESAQNRAAIFNVFFISRLSTSHSPVLIAVSRLEIAWSLMMILFFFNELSEKLKTSFAERHQPDDHSSWCSIIRNFPLPFCALRSSLWIKAICASLWLPMVIFIAIGQNAMWLMINIPFSFVSWAPVISRQVSWSSRSRQCVEAAQKRWNCASCSEKNNVIKYSLSRCDSTFLADKSRIRK